MKRKARKFGKALSISLVLLLIISMIFSAAADTGSGTPRSSVVCEDIRVMSFNVLDYNTTNSTYAEPRERAEAIVGMIREIAPDVIGIQEACCGCAANGYFNWNTFLRRNLADIYDCRVLTDEGAVSTTIAKGLMIFYRPDRFEKLDSGYHVYTVDNGRALQWVSLKDTKAGDREICIFNTHFSLKKDNEVYLRTQEYAELAQTINTVAVNTPFFAIGDYNSRHGEGNTVYNDGTINNFLDQTGYADGAYKAIENEVPFSIYSQTVDHIFYDPALCTAQQYQRIASTDYTPRLSDHHAIILRCSYDMPALITATSATAAFQTRFVNGAYYIENLTTRTDSTYQATVTLQGGAVLYKDEACTISAGPTIDVKTPVNNVYYVKINDTVYPVYIRSWNALAYSYRCVDASFKGMPAGTQALYADKWYARKVTIGTNGFATIQDAVNAAADNDTILVAPGEYREDVVFTGKNLKFWGQNRNNVKALNKVNGHYELNAAGRTYETQWDGSVTYVYTNGAGTGSLEVNGFKFIGRTTVGQVRVIGGTENDVLSLTVRNNVFECFTDGAALNGSAVHGNSSVQKNADIYDNLFCLTESPTYTPEGGSTRYFINRAITLRNMKDVKIRENRFEGYIHQLFFLASEISDSNVTPGWGNLRLVDNDFVDCKVYRTMINNIGTATEANIVIGDNRLTNSTPVYVSFADTAAQNNNNTPSVKANIHVTVKTTDTSLVNLVNTQGISINYVNTLPS